MRRIILSLCHSLRLLGEVWFISEGQRNATHLHLVLEFLSISLRETKAHRHFRQADLCQLRVTLGPSGRRDAKKVLKNTHAVLINEGLACCSSGKACPSSDAASLSSALSAFPPCWKREDSVSHCRNAWEESGNRHDCYLTFIVRIWNPCSTSVPKYLPTTTKLEEHAMLWLTHAVCPRGLLRTDTSTRSGELCMHLQLT